MSSCDQEAESSMAAAYGSAAPQQAAAFMAVSSLKNRNGFIGPLGLLRNLSQSRPTEVEAFLSAQRGAWPPPSGGRGLQIFLPAAEIPGS